jgi:uncharacterized protein
MRGTGYSTMDRRDRPPSDIRIDREGVWYYRGVEMSRRDIVRYFYQHLQRDESDCFIQIGPQRFPVDVEDAPYAVIAVYYTGEKLELLLSDDCIEELNPETLRVAKDNVLYCRVKSGAFDARFSRSSYYRFAENVHYDRLQESYFIEMGGRPFYFPMECRRPG